MPTLDQIAADPTQAEMLTPDAARELWQQVVALIVALQPRLYAQPTEIAESDQLLTAKEVAQRYPFSVTTLYRNAAEFPFTRRVGKNRGRVKFSEQGIERYLAHRHGR